MHIYYASRKLEALCLYEQEAKKSLGSACAKTLRRRIAELHAARSVADLVVGRPILCKALVLVNLL